MFQCLGISVPQAQIFGGDDAEEVKTELENKQNSGNGRKDIGYAHISQKNPSIANMRYGNSTIGEAGCGPIAATNLINRANIGNMVELI